MNKTSISFITSNKHKIQEINKILGTNFVPTKLKIDEIQSLILNQVVKAKAKEAYKIIKEPILVADVSLEIEALGGLPGTFIKFFIETLGPAGTAKLIKGKNRRARLTDAIAYFDGKLLKIFKGTVEGTIAEAPKGQSGFGFDVVFIPKGYNKTYAQMSQEEKNEISHRSIALKKLKKYLT